MTTNRLPFIGSGRAQEAGALATKKQDFNAHTQGNGFRHTADNIDMNPVIPLVVGNTVQKTLETLHSLIISTGTGFLSIGSVDGYTQGDYNVGTDQTPTLYDTFNAAFIDTRLQNGGLILVLAGTYHLRSSVTVPAGVSIMGEYAGTTIIGEMQEVPMFIVQKPNNGIELVAGVLFDIGSNVDSVKFANLILADNLDGYVLFGEPSMTTTPMIQAQISSNLICENVSFVGKIHTGAVPRTKTQSAIGYTSSGTDGTILKMKNCYFDGLRCGISFIPGNSSSDFLIVEDCKARIYGTEDAGSQAASLNSFIVMSHSNTVISNNYFYGAGAYANTFVNIISGTGTNVKFVMTGNIGNPNVSINGNLVVDSSGSSYQPVIMDNNWGSYIQVPGLLDNPVTQTWVGDNSWTGNETHTGIETHSGTESHSGTEIHSGAVSFDDIIVTTGNSYLLDARNETRFSSISPLFNPASWLPDSKGNLIDQNNTGSVIFYYLDVPHGQRLFTVSCTILPQFGHGALPATKPKLEMCRLAVASNTETIIGTASDAPSTVLIYEAIHELSLTFAAHVVDKSTYRYYIRFTSELGANSLAGLAVVNAKFIHNRTSIGED